MPDRTRLRIGDRIRLLCVPAADLAQRERELADGVELPGWTADTIERIIELDPVVTIDRIDEYGLPWFEVGLIDRDGTVHFHSLAVMEDDSWAIEV